MKRLWIGLCAALMLVCSCEDLSHLDQVVNSQHTSVLEKMLYETNTNIAAIQVLLQANHTGDGITTIDMLSENGVEYGARMTLKSGISVCVYYKNNEVSDNDLNIHTFGYDKDADGECYWALDGTWVCDERGNKRRVLPDDTDNRVVPKFKIEDNSWAVSYDGCKNWYDLGLLISENNISCYFENVIINDSSVSFELNDGTLFSVLKYEAFDIEFSSLKDEPLILGDEAEIPYKIIGCQNSLSLFAVSNNKAFDISIVEETESTGKLVVVLTEEAVNDAEGEILLFAVNENGYTVSKVIKVKSGILQYADPWVNDIFYVGHAASSIEISISTNLEYQVVSSVEWLSWNGTKTVSERTLIIDVKENKQPQRRDGVVSIVSGPFELNLSVSQKGYTEDFVLEYKRNEYDGWAWEEFEIFESLTNIKGQTIAEVLGYESFADVLKAIGDENQSSSFGGEVVVTGYDTDTGKSFGNIPYIWSPVVIGYGLDRDGNIANEYTAFLVWLLHVFEEGRSGFEFWINTNLLQVGEEYKFGVMFSRGERQAKVEVELIMEEYRDPELGKYVNPYEPGEYDVDVEATYNLSTPFDSACVVMNGPAEQLKKILGMTTYEIYEAFEHETLSVDVVLPDGHVMEDMNSICVNSSNSTGGQHVFQLNWHTHTFFPNDFHATLYVPHGNWWYDKPFGKSYVPEAYEAMGKSFDVTFRFTYNPKYRENTVINFKFKISFVNEPYDSDFVIVGADELKMVCSDGMYVAKNISFDKRINGFKIKNNASDIVYGMDFSRVVVNDRRCGLGQGENLNEVQVLSGTYDIWFDGSGELYVMSVGKSPIDVKWYTSGIPQNCRWYLYAETMKYPMTDLGDWNVCYGFVSDGVTVSIRGTDDHYEYHMGGDYKTSNEPFDAYENYGGFWLPWGTYDIYIDDFASQIYVMTAGQKPDAVKE